MRVTVEISPGELFDKITILSIKQERIGDPEKLANVGHEKATLEASAAPLRGRAGLEAMVAELKAINESLWEIEDAIRDLEARACFDAGFVELARSVYITNDRRAATKRAIDALFGSDIGEVKSYRPYLRDADTAAR